MVRWEKINRCALDWRNSCCQGVGERAGDLSGSGASAIHRGRSARGSERGHEQLWAVSVRIFHLPNVECRLACGEIDGSEQHLGPDLALMPGPRPPHRGAPSQGPTPLSGPFCESDVITSGREQSWQFYSVSQVPGREGTVGFSFFLLLLTQMELKSGLFGVRLPGRGAGLGRAVLMTGSPAPFRPDSGWSLGPRRLLLSLPLPLSALRPQLMCPFLQEAAPDSGITVPQTTLMAPAFSPYGLVC